MRTRFAWAVVVVGVLGVMAGSTATVLATPPVGATPVPLAPVGHYSDINTNTDFDGWKLKFETHGDSDMYVTQVTIQPGGSTGWHLHPGPSFLVVKSGTATLYQGDDATCTPQVVTAGNTIFELAKNVHIVRNEGDVPLVNVVVQFVPKGAPRSISMPDPGNCSF
ncbi:MAG TPA: cupin domain-containing protein [Gemmatimonadaceae bacterium]|nr:cupin domain-containing protein [Gemmatimonadaceae bacterium]